MSRPWSVWLVSLGASLAIAAPAPTRQAGAQTTTKQELASLLPSAADLPGFAQERPADERPAAADLHFLAEELHDVFELDQDLLQVYGRGAYGRGDRIARLLYSTDGMWSLSLELIVCDSADSAASMLRGGRVISQTVQSKGTFSGRPRLGDECIRWPPEPGGTALVCRLGTAFVMVHGSLSGRAARAQMHDVFPPETVEAIAEGILLRLSRLPRIGSGAGKSVQVTVNGKALAGRATLVGGRPVVPAAAVARAAAWGLREDRETGSVTLSRMLRSVTLAPWTMHALVGGERAPVHSGVIRESGQLWLDLEELARLMGGAMERPGTDRAAVRI